LIGLQGSGSDASSIAHSGGKGGAFSALAFAPEAYILLTETMYVHGGGEGLRQAVLLVRDAHRQGILRYYTSPHRTPRTESDSQERRYTSPTTHPSSSSSAAAAAAAVGEMAVAHENGGGGGGGGGGGTAEAGSWLLLEGPSTVHAMVVMLAWLSELAHAAR
jgi:hypothetical protein